MSKEVVQVSVHAVVPTNSGCAVFIGDDEKVFVIYVDPGVGSAISMFINGTTKERPLTHDLIGLILTSLGAKVERIVINDLQSGTYFGRLILSAENEIQQRKIVELDARPSDCIALACQQRAPIYVSKPVWEEVEDMSDVLRKLGDQKESGEEEEEG
ncbi:MAG TPA: bifunctional nuclease family protein [Chthoniobacterales bacterium]